MESRTKAGTEISSVEDLLNRASQYQKGGAGMGSTSPPINVSKELYIKLRNHEELDKLRTQFEKKNPGYTLYVSPVQGNHEGYSVQVAVSTAQSVEDIVHMANSLELSYREGTTQPLRVSRDFCTELQKPAFMKKTIAALEEAYPGHRFQINIVANPSFGNTNEYSIQLSSRPLDSVKEIGDELGKMKAEAGREFTSPPLAVSKEMYKNLKDPKTRDDAIRQLEKASGLNLQINFVNSPPENPLLVQFSAYDGRKWAGLKQS